MMLLWRAQMNAMGQQQKHLLRNIQEYAHILFVILRWREQEIKLINLIFQQVLTFKTLEHIIYYSILVPSLSAFFPL